MKLFLNKLSDFLKKRFPGADTDLVITVPNKRVGGYLIWHGFDEMEPLDRLNAVREAVEPELTPEERRSISAILTLTPEEATAAKAG